MFKQSPLGDTCIDSAQIYVLSAPFIEVFVGIPGPTRAFTARV